MEIIPRVLAVGWMEKPHATRRSNTYARSINQINIDIYQHIIDIYLAFDPLAGP
jgi:hypothetical protein